MKRVAEVEQYLSVYCGVGQALQAKTSHGLVHSRRIWEARARYPSLSSYSRQIIRSSEPCTFWLFFLLTLFFFYSSLFILCLLKWDCCKTQAEDITEKYAFPLFTFTIHNRQLHIASRVKASSLLLFHFRNVKVLPQLSINVCIRRQTCRLKLIRWAVI